MLHLLSTSKTQQELTAALKLMAKVLPRPEFDILQSMSSSGLYRWTPEQQKKARQYRSLLIKLQIMIATNLAEYPVVDANGSLLAISQTFTLYPRLLAILYWRLPYVGVLIRKAVGLHPWPLSKIEDFSERPELPPPPTTPASAPSKLPGAGPKRGRVKADSKAPPPLDTSIFTAVTAVVPANPTVSQSAVAQRSSSEGAKSAPPMAATSRPYSASLRSPPPVEIETLSITPNKLTSSQTASDTNTTDGATNPREGGREAGANPAGVSPTIDGASSPPMSLSPPPGLNPGSAPSSSDLLLDQASRTSPPPSPNSSQEGESPRHSSPPPGTDGDNDSLSHAKNPKMIRRTAVNNGISSSAAVSSQTPNSAVSKMPTSPFAKPAVPSTTIELDDELTDAMILPKTGNVPRYPDGSVPDAASKPPQMVPWASWMRVSKKLGYFSTDGQFIAFPSNTVSPSTTKKKHRKSSSQPGSSNGSSSSSASGDKGLPQTVLVEPRIALGERCLIYNWVNFHQTLVEMGPEAHPSPGCIPSPAYFVEQEPRIQWLTWFEQGRSIIFVLFFKEWVNHTAHMLSRTNELVGVKWNTIPGYRQMEMALQAIYHPILAQRMSMPLIDASRPLSRCNPDIVGWLVKWCFNQTNAHSTDSVNAMFSKLEMWFAELDRNLQRIPASFDAEYFVQGLEVIVTIDHHVILARLLSFLFTYAHLLRGRVRRTIIEEFVVKKHFFTLFLHWDDVVRNYYQQFLIYKAVRIRKLAHVRHGLVPPTPEALAQAKETAAANHTTAVNRRSMYGRITTQAAVSNTALATSTASSSSNPAPNTAPPSPFSVHGLPMLPLPADSFTSGADAEGFLVDPQDDEYLQDMRLFTITESLVRIVDDQITQGGKHAPSGPESQTAYPKSLEIYAPRSLSEYNFYLSRYEQKYMCARLIPMSILQDKRSAIPKSNKPKNSD